MNKRPVAIDHTHEPSTSTYDGFQSKDDKSLVDQLRIDKVKYDNTIVATKEPTGFTNNENITVTYNSTTRKVTLSGTFQAYYKGELIRELIDGWTSDAHDTPQAVYYLYYCDTGFVFSTTPWDFSCLMIAFIQYNSHQIGIREVHGFMPNTVHEFAHNVIGSYLVSGGDLSDYTLSSTTSTLRRPVISNTVIADEDLKSTVLALSNKSYTQRYLTGSAVRTFNTAQPEIIAVSGSQPYYNLNTGGTWSQALFSNNSYGAIFVVAVPTTNDAGSQVYRYMFVQPQMNSSVLSDIQALTPNSLVHGVSSSLVSEFVFIGKIIIRYTGGNWSIVSVEKLTGTRISQTSNVAGAYLTAVTHDTTLSGDGTALSPLGVFGKQDTLVSGTNIKTINGSSVLGSGDLAVSGLDNTKLALEGGTMTGTIASTALGIIRGYYLSVLRGYLASDATGIGFLDSVTAAWASRVPLGTRDWEVIGKTRIAEGLAYSDANNSTIFNRYIVQKGGTSLGTGYWTKFYDGTMFMWFTITVTLAIQTADSATGGYVQASANTLNFPVSFVDANYTAVIGGGSGCIGGRINTKATGSLTYFLRTITSSASASRTFEIQLKGRWY